MINDNAFLKLQVVSYLHFALSFKSSKERWAKEVSFELSEDVLNEIKSKLKKEQKKILNDKLFAKVGGMLNNY